MNDEIEDAAFNNQNNKKGQNQLESLKLEENPINNKHQEHPINNHQVKKQLNNQNNKSENEEPIKEFLISESLEQDYQNLMTNFSDKNNSLKPSDFQVDLERLKAEM